MMTSAAEKKGFSHSEGAMQTFLFYGHDSGILATFKDRKMSHRPRHEIIYGASSGCLVDWESCTEKGKTSLPYK